MTRVNKTVLRATCYVLRATEAGVRAFARRTAHVALVGLAVVGLSGCTDWAGYDLDRFWGYIPALSTLRGTVAYTPNTLPRVPAEGTIPVESPMGETLPPFTQLQLDSVGRVLSNPLPASPEVLARGQVEYDRQCSVCHGPEGAGNGTVVGAGKFPFAPAINSAATAARSDGYIYGVIRVGRGLMPAYGERVPNADRWAIVHYVRQLERQAGAATAAAPAPAPATPTAPR